MKRKSEAYHLPVMLQECLEGLRIRTDGIYVDVTFGGGGHSKAILAELGENGRLYAFDQDEDAAGNLPDDERLVFIQHNYRYLKQFLDYLQAIPVDGILADLGISSYQIDEPGKGFAHRLGGNLDMRMDRGAALSAADVVQHYSEQDLLRIFRNYGEIKNAGKLVKIIIEKRATVPMDTIEGFRDAISTCIPGKEESKYLSQVFQALRIEVNGELKALEELLKASLTVLAPGGRLVVMSYHSLEDRMVKNFMQAGNVEGVKEEDLYGRKKEYFKIITRKPIVPSDEEIQANRRARSAKLRIAEKL